MKTNTALERHFANTPSARISYLQAGGEGSVALFVHGVIVNGYLWRHQLAALSDLRRCIAVDLMGHGHTVIAPEQPVSFEAQAEMLAQFLDTLGLDQVDLLRALKVPTLVVWGTGDIFFSKEWSDFLTETLSGRVTQVELAKCTFLVSRRACGRTESGAARPLVPRSLRCLQPGLLKPRSVRN